MIAMFLFGIGLWILGSILEGSEKRKREDEERRGWEDFDKKYPGFRTRHPD